MPGFRFHPTEEELIEFYLRRKVEGKRFNVELITFLDLYRYDPWELPAMAAIGEKEWYFYVPRDRKYRNGDRPNRVTASGYWKATGADRTIKADNSRPIGLKKTLVFYSGKAPKGVRSSWIMNEYRLPPDDTDRYHKTEISLCRVYKRTGIDDGGHGHPASARSTPSRGVVTAPQQDNKQQASSSSTPTPPTTPSKMMQFLHGECTSSQPAAICRNSHHAAAAAHSNNKAAAAGAQRQSQFLPTKPYCSGYQQLSTASSAGSAVGAAVDHHHHQQQQQQAGTGAAAVSTSSSSSRNASYALATASTYSLLSLVNAASMGGSGSAAAIDELSTLVGHVHGPPAYFNHQAAAAGGHGFVLPLPTTPSSQQPMAALGTLPLSLAAISDKIWDWNPVGPDAAARDYGSAAGGFK